MAPFKYCSREKYGLAVGPEGIQYSNDISGLNNVDLVITQDQTKWSICPVFEMSDDQPISQYGDDKLTLKSGVTKDWNGNTLEEGLGYFPGYAIDVLTGERLIPETENLRTVNVVVAMRWGQNYLKSGELKS